MGLAPNNVYQENCIQGLQEIEPGTIDLVFADPPFNIGYEYDVYHDAREDDEYLDWSEKWMRGVHRALKPDGTFWLAIGDEYAAELKLIAQRQLGFVCRSWVIWYYTFGVNCKRGFSRSHTHLFHFVKDPEHFTFNADNPAVRVPSARQLVYAERGRIPRAACPTTPGSSDRRTFPMVSRQKGTPGTFHASPARSRSARASTAAKCQSNFWGELSAAAPSRPRSCSIRSAAAARRWSWPRSSTGNGSASSSQPITPKRSKPGWNERALAHRWMASPIR